MDAEDSDESRSMLHAARKGGRRLLGPDGILFNVYELDWGYDRRGRTLVFESDHAMRRVRTYPAHWRELTDEELYAVSWRP